MKTSELVGGERPGAACIYCNYCDEKKPHARRCPRGAKARAVDCGAAAPADVTLLRCYNQNAIGQKPGAAPPLPREELASFVCGISAMWVRRAKLADRSR